MSADPIPPPDCRSGAVLEQITTAMGLSGSDTVDAAWPADTPSLLMNAPPAESITCQRVEMPRGRRRVVGAGRYFVQTSATLPRMAVRLKAAAGA
jgi:hypothetical protein